jgi:hypothetical protein
MAIIEAYCPVCRRTVHIGEDDPHVCPVCSARLVGPGLDEARAARIADNESRVREVNERIESHAQGSVAFPAEEKVGFVCECGDLDCSATIYLTVQEYEAVRAGPARFVLLPGHELPSAETVAERHESYQVVEKIGSARERAIEEDPRS